MNRYPCAKCGKPVYVSQDTNSTVRLLDGTVETMPNEKDKRFRGGKIYCFDHMPRDV